MNCRTVDFLRGDQLAERPELASQVVKLHSWSLSEDDEEAFLRRAFLAFGTAFDYSTARWVKAASGNWQILARFGLELELPTTIAAEALERRQILWMPPWLLVPYLPEKDPLELLAFAWREQPPWDVLAQLAGLVVVLRQLAAAMRTRLDQQRRIEQLENLLGYTRRWLGIKEIESLLVEIAQAATRLIGCERASIFLWDRRTHTLVARPALGVPGGELRLSDSSGLVGRVIQSGEPALADEELHPEWIDHSVDKQLRFQTKSVLCVPLRGAAGLLGAFELINKRTGRFTDGDQALLSELAAHAAGILENAQDRQALLTTRSRLAELAASQVELVGRSPAIEAIRSVIHRVAETDLAVLILGEHGTGKEVVAQAIHYWGKRRHQPFVAVNCAAIPETLAESELFGHEKGAFTGADESRAGKFELASSGTLFLDEIGDLSLACQAKLLRVLEQRVFTRVGGTALIPTDARIIAATNQDLREAVRKRRFRDDLFYRLNVVTIEIPPLRARPHDILLLAEHFLNTFCRRAGRRVPQLTPAAQECLLKHPWPGNVRELRNAMERLAYLHREDVIDAADLAFIFPHKPVSQSGILLTRIAEGAPPDQPALSLAEATRQFQIAYVRQVLEDCQGNFTEAARRLRLHRSNFYRKLRQLGVETRALPPEAS